MESEFEIDIYEADPESHTESESEIDIYEANPESHIKSESHTESESHIESENRTDPESDPDQYFIENQQGLPNYQYGIYRSSPPPVDASSPQPVDAHVNCTSGPPPADAHVNCDKLIDEGAFFSSKERFESWVFR